MMAITSQAQDAINRLKAAGFKRKEFRVRTPRNKHCEYAAYPNVSLRLRREFTGQDAVNLLANGFDLIYLALDGNYSVERLRRVEPIVTDREYGEPARVRVIRC